MKAAAVLALLLLSGCATIVTRCTEASYGDELYPATQMDLEGAAYLCEDQRHGGDEFHWLAVLPVLDMPFSLVSDTVLLPVDLAVMGCRACK